MTQEQNTFNQEPQEDFLQLSDIWNMIWGYKWWYVGSIFVCLVLACLYLYKTPDTFSRTTQVIIDEDSQDAAMRDLASFTNGMMKGKSASNVNNEVIALASHDLMQIVVERLRLETQYYEQQPFRSVELYTSTPVELQIVADAPASSFSFTVSKTDSTGFELSGFKVKGEKIKSPAVAGKLGDTVTTPAGRFIISPTMNIGSWDRDITITWSNSTSKAKSYCSRLTTAISGKQTSVVSLTVQDCFPSRAENILNTLLDVYNEQWIHDKNRSARKTTEFINERLTVIEHELGGIEENLKSYKQDNKLTDMQALSESYLKESSEYASKSFEVNNQLSIAGFIREYLTNPANSGQLIPADLGLANSNVETQIKEYNDMVLMRDRYLANSSDKNPLIIDLNNSLEAIKATIIRSIDNLIATLTLQAEKIQSQEEQIMSRIASSSGQELALLSIERQQKVKETLYIYLLQKREENEIASLVNVGNTRLIVTPTGSPAPVSPKKMLIMLFALVAGAAIPFGVLFLKRMSDTTIHTKGDLTKLSAPFLGEIPQLKSKIKGRITNIGRIKFDNSNCRIVVGHGKRDPLNEAFRVIRTNLDIMTGNDKTKLVMLTSFNPNSGKTFTAMNIATSYALKGEKALLVDLDLRKGTLSKIVDLDKNSGVSTFLTGDKDDINELIRRYEDTIDILPSGKLPPNPTELLLSGRFDAMLEKLKQQYDHIFFDCPPIDIVADTSLIAQKADLTLFVMRAGLMDKRALPLIENLYREGKYRRMTLVLNGVEAKKQKYSGYGYGYGSYGYGY